MRKSTRTLGARLWGPELHAMSCSKKTCRSGHVGVQQGAELLSNVVCRHLSDFMFMSRGGRIRTQMYLLLFAVAIPLIVLLAFAIFDDMKHDERQASATAMVLAQNVADDVQAVVGDTHELLQQLARRPLRIARTESAASFAVYARTRRQDRLRQRGSRDRSRAAAARRNGARAADGSAQRRRLAHGPERAIARRGRKPGWRRRCGDGRRALRASRPLPAFSARHHV
ncbi:MAG: hypothetical protein H6R12_1734 [Proteobacteria bacterium]|nr:hypothetical protein [Pseudomonadota bacterium]